METSVLIKKSCKVCYSRGILLRRVQGICEQRLFNILSKILGVSVLGEYDTGYLPF